ncbi:hypothetical protein [Bordetella hinzii]|uniref:hypothetical protein n=1 Tax=Bordetella hinzii TaxID=103855 RepID=UPI00115365E3|nr:hypothetical protein [Bordetella hinzii]
MASAARGDAVTATRILLGQAKVIAAEILGTSAPEAVLQVFERLCLETDLRGEPGEESVPSRALH